jgi:hypothetical protein
LYYICIYCSDYICERFPEASEYFLLTEDDTCGLVFND